MRGEFFFHVSNVHAPKPLVIRGGLGRTFGSLVSFLALILLAWGGYVLEEAFAHPVDAQTAGLLAAAFAIALGLLLLFYLFKPRRIAGLAHAHARSELSPRPAKLASRDSAEVTTSDHLRRDLAYHRIYVDHSRIRP